jgi:isoleucyl-tRNA synthetase
MHRPYIARQLREFADMVENRPLSRTMRPIFYSSSLRTALAGAELFYRKRVSFTAKMRLALPSLDSGSLLCCLPCLVVCTTLPRGRSLPTVLSHSTQ